MEEQKIMAENIIGFREIVTPLLEWYGRNARILPWRENTDPYRVWVSEIMLQQTRVETVKPYFERFLKQLPTIADLAAAEEETLLKLWEGLGYYTRVRNLQKAAQVICKEHGGVFPEAYEEIAALPGIGPYTAGAISSISFEKPVPGGRRKRAARCDAPAGRWPRSCGSGPEKTNRRGTCRGLSARGAAVILRRA